MSDDKQIREVPPVASNQGRDVIEECGIDTATVASIVSATGSVVSAGAAVYSAYQNRPSDPPPPQPPSIELPPGVDPD